MHLKINLFLSTAIVSFILTTNAFADELGNHLADSVCLYFSLDDSNRSFQSILDKDITQIGIAEKGYEFEEHSRKHYYWKKLSITPLKGDILAECKIYETNHQDLYAEFHVIAEAKAGIDEYSFKFVKQ